MKKPFSLKRIVLARLAVLMLAVVAIALQGCGNADNGAKQDLRDQLAMLQGELDGANAAKTLAEQAAMDAAMAQAEAETVTAEARMERDQANVARGAAETARTVAEQATMDAAAAQAAAKQSAMDAAMAQAEAETGTAEARMERDRANAARRAAETARMVAEQATMDAAMAQAEAEAATAEARMERDRANAARGAAETARTVAEQATMDAAAAQAAAKQSAMDAVMAQAEAETATAEARMERDRANAARRAAETARMVAEQATMDAAMAQAEAEAATAEARMERDQANAARRAAETARMVAEQATMDAAMAQAEAEAATAEARMERDQANVARRAAETARTVAEQATMDAAMATAEARMERDQADAARRAAETATATAEKAKVDAEAARTAAENKTIIYKAQLEALRVQIDTEAAMAASEYAKELLYTALVKTQADADATATGLQPVAPAVTVSVSSNGILTARADGYAMSDMPVGKIEGWRGAMLTNEQGDTAIVYSDVGNDGPMSPLERYQSLRPTATEPRKWRVNAAAIPWSAVRRSDDIVTIRTIIITTETSGGAAIPRSTDVMSSFRGSVHNIPGTFSCAGNPGEGCETPPRHVDGTVDVLTVPDATDWTFVPDKRVLIDTADRDYLVFGWWLDKGPDGNPDYLRLIGEAQGVGAVRNATNTPGSNRGSATYKGGAAGQYALASTTDYTYEGGTFTARATLMVDFDVDLTPATAANDRAGIVLSGLIDNFMTGGTARPNWTVKLKVDNNGIDDDDVLPTGTLVPAADATSRLLTEWSLGGAVTGTGTWAAAYFGGNPAVANTAGIPTAVIGTFGAEIVGMGRLQGAFGANRVDVE